MMGGTGPQEKKKLQGEERITDCAKHDCPAKKTKMDLAI